MTVSRRSLLVHTAAAGAVGMPARAAVRGPSIVWVSIDGLSSADLGRVSDGGGLARLAHTGAHFDHFHAADTAAEPARASLWTGRPTPEHGLLVPGAALPPDREDLGGWLARHGGYDVVCCGGIGLRGRPLPHGARVLVPSGGAPALADAARVRGAVAYLQNQPRGERFLLSVRLEGLARGPRWAERRRSSALPDDLALPPRWVPTAPAAATWPEPARVVEDRATDPASTWEPPEPQLSRLAFLHRRWLAEVDTAVVVLLDALAASAHRDDAIVVVTGDAGLPTGQHHRTAQGAPTDAVARVPLFLWSERLVPAGVHSRLASGIDLAATICDYAGVDGILGGKGASLRPTVEGRATPGPTAVFTTCLVEGVRTRSAELALTRFRDDDTQLLFHLPTDPDEAMPRGSDPGFADARARLTQAQADWEAGLQPVPAWMEGLAAARAAVR